MWKKWSTTFFGTTSERLEAILSTRTYKRISVEGDIVMDGKVLGNVVAAHRGPQGMSVGLLKLLVSFKLFAF